MAEPETPGPAIDPYTTRHPSMPAIGQRAPLLILREKPFGLILDGGPLGEILLPRNETPPRWQPGTTLDVFIHTDSEDRPVATLKRPLAMPGEFARLKCVAVTAVGAFLDWGLPKDLLVPFREQKTPMEAGKHYIVRVRVDEETQRVVATARLARHLDLTRPSWIPGDAVDLMIYGKTELGYKAIIEGTHSGLLYANEVFQDLRQGQRIRGYIRECRRDGKIDLTLQPGAKRRVEDLETSILTEMRARGGALPYGDDSTPEEIREAFGVSKRTFKQAVGALLKKGRIVLTDRGVSLADDADWSPPGK
jgi:predicted RNA-binding protein (virulence factor B family)